MLFWVTQATSWNILSGYSGYFSFGQAAYVGIGAYTTAVLFGRHGVNFYLTILVGRRALRGAGAGDRGASRSGCGRCAARSSRCSPSRCRSSSPRSPGSTTPSTAARASSSPIPEFPAGIGLFQDFLYLLNLLVAGARSRWRSRSSTPGSAGRWPPCATPRTWPRGWASRPSGTSCWRCSRARCIGGVGGSLFALQIGFVAVDSVFHLTIPLFVIVMSVLGGRTHWLGPVVGAALIVLPSGPADRVRPGRVAADRPRRDPRRCW